MTQPQLPALYAALARATANASSVAKDAQNSFHRYKYASAEAVIAEAREPLAAEGISVVQSAWRVRARENAEGGYFADLEVTYAVLHKDGGVMECVAETPVIREKGRPEDKAVATALTYSLGYFLRGLLMLPRVDEEHEVDRRDDREYEPRNGNGRAQTRGQASKTEAPPFDLAAALASIKQTSSKEELRALGAKFDAAPEDAKPKLKAAYSEQQKALASKAEAA